MIIYMILCLIMNSNIHMNVIRLLSFVKLLLNGLDWHSILQLKVAVLSFLKK